MEDYKELLSKIITHHMNGPSYIKRILKDRLYNKKKQAYLKSYNEIFKLHPELNKSAYYEKEWLEKWKKYDSSIKPFSYRIFSRYIGSDINIIPLELLPTLYEPILTPGQFLNYYNDKNCLGKIIPSSFSPIVYLRNINNIFYDGNYNFLDRRIVDSYLDSLTDVDILIVKPSVSRGGANVKKFYKESNQFIDKKQNVLSSDYLKRAYGCDYIIEECIRQSDSTAIFNKSSVNTIRIATFRDSNGIIHPLKAFLRIGVKGQDVDNTHAGGMACGINDEGYLGKYVCDLLGNTSSIFNEIDFSKTREIENFCNIKEFAIKVSSYILHHNLVALDVALNQDNTPKILEINIGGFSGWGYQFNSGSVFGEFTDDITEYCYKENHKVTIESLLKYKG